MYFLEFLQCKHVDISSNQYLEEECLEEPDADTPSVFVANVVLK